MTREEAIEVIKEYRDNLIISPSNQLDGDVKAFDMAISALNSLEEVYAKGYNDGFMQAEVNFENDKALSQEPKAGHWIRVTDKTGHLVWECDKCSWQQRLNTNFCPDCGAKMESEE